jgi:phage shock protein A
MALLERVATLLRANITDVLSKAEDPEKLARQLVLDMENQLIQVKTQVAIALADKHLLLQKKTEHTEAHTQWMRKAELAVARQRDDMARAALERAVSHQRIAEGLAHQLADQTAEAETLRAAYTRLQQKLIETQARVDMLAAQLRRSRAVQRATAAQASIQEQSAGMKSSRLASSVDDAGSKSRAARTMLHAVSAESLEDRFTSVEQSDQIEALLLELKEKLPRLS